MMLSARSLANTSFGSADKLLGRDFISCPADVVYHQLEAATDIGMKAVYDAIKYPGEKVSAT